MHAWLDVTAGVAGDMLMGALVDAGADLEQVQRAVRAVAGDAVTLRREEVTRAGLRATKVHVDLVVDGSDSHSWPELRTRVQDAELHPETRQHALAALELFVAGYSRGHGIQPDQVVLAEVAALDLLTDVVGDCEAIRSLGVTSVSASPVALGSGRIHTSHGDLPVPVPAVAELALGWGITRPAAPARLPAEAASAAPSVGQPVDSRYLPLGQITAGADGVITEGPALSVGSGDLGELATPTGMALLRTLAARCEPLPAMTLRGVGIGAGGRDVPGRPNVVRVLLGEL